MSVFEIIDEITKECIEKADKDAFSELKNEGKIQEVCLLAHPKNKWLVGELFKHEVKRFPILWSECVEEDRFYMVTDEETIARMKEIMKWC